MKLFLQPRIDRTVTPPLSALQGQLLPGHALMPRFALPYGVASAARNAKFWIGCFVAAVFLGLGFAAVYPTDPPKVPPVSKLALIAPTPVDDLAQDARPDAPMPVDLYNFALNAFLVPLLDDAVPPQWTDVAMEFACGPATTVMVDGQPMVPGQPIPTKAFTVRWMMDKCSPMGPESVELSGGVELVVHRKGVGLSAVVMPHHLRVDSSLGRAWLRGPFNAEIEMDTLAPMKRSKTAKP